jgi:hypothetical protein
MSTGRDIFGVGGNAADRLDHGLHGRSLRLLEALLDNLSGLLTLLGEGLTAGGKHAREVGIHGGRGNDLILTAGGGALAAVGDHGARDLVAGVVEAGGEGVRDVSRDRAGGFADEGLNTALGVTGRGERAGRSGSARTALGGSGGAAVRGLLGADTPRGGGDSLLVGPDFVLDLHKPAKQIRR